VILPREPWRRNQYVTVAMVFVVFTGFAFVIPFLPLYVRELGVDRTHEALWAGVLIGIAPLLAGLLAPLWGRMGDRYGQKGIAIKALVAYVFLLALTSVVTSVEELLALRIGVGLFGGIGPLGLAMATSLAPREETGRAVGMVQAAQILSAAVGPLAGGWLADTVGIRQTFLATAGLCAVALLFVMRYYQEAPRAAAPGDWTRAPGFTDVLRTHSIPSLLVVLFLVNFVGRSFTPILPLHLHELGVDPARLAFSTGMLVSVYSVAAAISATMLGRAARTRSPRALLVATLVAGALTVLPMARVPSYGWILALAILLGLASGGSLTLCYTIGGLMVPAEVKTTAFGFFSGAALFGGAISPAIAGLLARWHLRGIYFVDAAIFALLAIALLPSLRKGVESKP
jgi:MFS transporter, DHA1 family, multidrug resistance protein